MNNTYETITKRLICKVRSIEDEGYAIFLLCHEIDKLKDRLDAMQKETFEGDK